MRKLWILLCLLMLSVPAAAETPDEFNQCSGGGSGAKKETALNQQQHVLAQNGIAESQQEFDDCFHGQIDKISEKVRSVGWEPSGIGGDFLEDILEMGKQEVCQAVSEKMGEFGAVFDVASGWSGSPDALTRELNNILKKELSNAVKEAVSFKIPDVSQYGVNNVMGKLIKY